MRETSEELPSSSRIITSRTSASRSKTAKKTLEELGRLRFDRLNNLYGRDDEIEALHLAYKGLRKRELKNRDTKQPINMVTLAGVSGTGKSAIVKEFQRRVLRQDKTALIASGKFDQHQRTSPYHAFITALTQLVSEFSKLADTENLQSTLGKNYHVLLDLIPNLQDLFPKEGKDEESSIHPDQGSYDVVRSRARFKFALSKFLSSVCQPKHKVIMFLDDLQWIDPASLDLLEFILLEPGLEESLLIIGSYRDNEVHDQHVLQQRLASVEKSRGQRIRRLRIDTLTLQNTHDLITDLLNTEPSYTRDLAEIAHKKVEGNTFFLIQFLIALQDDRLLSYNLATTTWQWDLAKIRKSTVVSNNVLTVLMGKMKRLDNNSRRMLTIMSFLGSSFEEIVVEIIATELTGSSLLPPVDTNENEKTNVMLEALVNTGFLEVVQDRSEKRVYCFAHDQIELAAISFQDENSVPELNLEMARVLYSKRFDFDFETMLFAIVDMYNQGRALIKSSKEASLLIDLNQQAGRSALESSAFAASTRYLRIAIDLISPEDRWEKRYERFLELQNFLIKAEYSNGEWDRLNKDIGTIINATGKPTLDKITAYSLKVTELASHQNKHKEAIALTVDVLRELEIVFRPGLGKLAIVGGLIKTKQLLKKIPMESILKKEEMDDVHKTVALDLLTAADSSLYAANPDLLMSSTLKIIRWSLKYGICKYTSRCLGIFAIVDFALGDLKSATKTCKLSIELAQKQNLIESQYAPTSAAYGFIFPWTEPMSSCAKQLYRGYEIGLETGDLEFGMMNITLYGFFCFSMGKPLSNLEADLGDYAKQMHDCHMELQRNFLCLTWQVLLNLLGRCEDPLSMDGEAMGEQAMVSTAKEADNPPLRAQLYCHKLQLCVYFGDFELGATLLPETRKIGTVNPANPIIWRTALFEGVVAFEFLRRGSKKYKSVGRRALGNVQKYVSKGNLNCVHILYLLQAEKEAACGKVVQARGLYDKSIVAAARSGFVNDVALANERCAEMMLLDNDEYWAKSYFERAHEAYAEIEAYGKVDHMVESNKLLRPKINLDAMKQDLPIEEPVETGATLETESMTYLTK